MKIKSIVLLVMLMIIPFVLDAAAEDTGAGNIVIKGGRLGSVAFPHRKHQDTLFDCKLCHNLFPKAAGSIERLKNKGNLKRKATMYQCVDCHKNKADKREKSGPTSCKGCHKK